MNSKVRFQANDTNKINCVNHLRRRNMVANRVRVIVTRLRVAEGAMKSRHSSGIRVPSSRVVSGSHTFKSKLQLDTASPCQSHFGLGRNSIRVFEMTREGLRERLSQEQEAFPTQVRNSRLATLD